MWVPRDVDASYSAREIPTKRDLTNINGKRVPLGGNQSACNLLATKLHKDWRGIPLIHSYIIDSRRLRGSQRWRRGPKRVSAVFGHVLLQAQLLVCDMM